MTNALNAVLPPLPTAADFVDYSQPPGTNAPDGLLHWTIFQTKYSNEIYSIKTGTFTELYQWLVNAEHFKTKEKARLLKLSSFGNYKK